MFSKTKPKSGSRGNGREARAAPSLISANLHIIGNLNSDGEVQVDGIIEGNVAGRSLTIGEKAEVKGEIRADDVMVHGIVSGRIRAHRVRLAKTAKVVGDICHEVLTIESGAYIEGHCKRLEGKRDESEKKINLVTDRDLGAGRAAAREGSSSP